MFCTEAVVQGFIILQVFSVSPLNPEAEVGNYMAESIARKRVVTLSAMDEPNLIPVQLLLLGCHIVRKAKAHHAQ